MKTKNSPLPPPVGVWAKGVVGPHPYGHFVFFFKKKNYKNIFFIKNFLVIFVFFLTFEGHLHFFLGVV
jgi:hypothetical protein